MGSIPAHESFYRGKSALVIGGAGFIGSHLTEALVVLGTQVTVLDCLLERSGADLKHLEAVRDRIRFVKGDTRDPRAVQEAMLGAGIVFNIAGQPSHVRCMEDPVEDLQINAQAQLYILEAARRSEPRPKVVYCGSRQVIGVAETFPVDERHPVAPVDAYGISKFAGERYHTLYARAHGLETMTLRLTNAYGPRQNAFDFIGVFMRRAAAGQELTVYGDGSQSRDYHYISDVVEAFLRAGELPAGEGRVYNLGGDEVCSILEFAKRLCALAGVPHRLVPFPEGRKSTEIWRYQGDYREFRKATGWCPAVKLDEGMRRTLDYFRSHA